jgi:hypothetical protein
VIKKPQRRRPRPELGCSAIGWMNIFMNFEKNRTKFEKD